MKKILFFSACLILLTAQSFAQNKVPDTVKTGIYITSIHDIDFKQNEYSINFWLWLTYKNREFDFMQNLEIPEAKTFTKSFSSIDSSTGKYYVLMKLQCQMKDSWKIHNFPFDKQNLRLSIENSQFDTKDLVFAIDTLGKRYDPKVVLKGWNIDSLRVFPGTKSYESTFGDPEETDPHETYSDYKVKVVISRDTGELFWKIFLGMYVSFLIAYICFYIHADNIDSRFGLSVGAVFAAIGNKYIIDASLPDSTSFTLVDTLHGLTLSCICLVIVASAWSLRLVKQNKLKQANRFDFIAAQVLLGAYLIINAYCILKARG